MNLATQSLAHTSITAAQLWHQLEIAETNEEIDRLFQSIWHNQEKQKIAIDAHAELANQIDAEIIAIKARMEFLVQLHQSAIDKLEGWRERLDQTVIYFNQIGAITAEIVGKQHRITLKENPPTCEISIDPSQLPDQYRRVETKTIISADKKAITDAWKQGIPVEGTKVYRRRKVIYSLLPSNLPQYQASTIVDVEPLGNQPQPTKKRRKKAD
ncbi:hypothetical protein NIES2119_27490 [[Phormidium ambiguum] IAM M-71]|uniref:Uncharacterized protein n=1 Tax=[Phormidium ambiguum] IAM M-71 TaxID=454136 RepID=A0A1U7I6Q0_9CYAN|nr:siphovirus Gp157 family protein [Phormidium ambiguum]OKH31971.1 hypothetical protein NIES2119_27490 [Phormidium ambiguum IAM M-71]